MSGPVSRGFRHLRRPQRLRPARPGAGPGQHVTQGFPTRLLVPHLSLLEEREIRCGPWNC